MVVDCRGTAWDVVAAGAPLSQLAGVIAGFVFAGTIVLLSQPRPTVGPGEQQTGAARVRALIPFFATFVAMGLNAYVFGLIAGEHGEDFCRRVWTAAAVASGMLAVGTVAAVSGIVLLVRAYLASTHLSPSDQRPLGYLERMLLHTVRLLSFVAFGLLIQRVFEFLKVWYEGRLHGIDWLWIVVAALALALIVAMRWRPSVTDPARFYDRVLRAAGLCTVLYSIVGTAVVGGSLGVWTEWRELASWVPWAAASAAAIPPFLAITGYVHAIHGILHLARGTDARAATARPLRGGEAGAEGVEIGADHIRGDDAERGV